MQMGMLLESFIQVHEVQCKQRIPALLYSRNR